MKELFEKTLKLYWEELSLRRELEYKLNEVTKELESLYLYSDIQSKKDLHNFIGRISKILLVEGGCEEND